MRILSLRHLVNGQRPNTLSSLKLSPCQMVGIEPCPRIHDRFISFTWQETSEPMTSKSASPREFAEKKPGNAPRRAGPCVFDISVARGFFLFLGSKVFEAVLHGNV